MWATDASYFRVVGWGYYYMVTVMDDYSRSILAHRLQRDMTSDSFIEVVQEAVDRTGMDQIQITDRTRLLSDNGPGYVSRAFRDYLGMVGIKHILATPFHPRTNGKLERYHQTLKRDVNQLPYEMPSDLEAAIVAFVSYYNYRRYHKVLGNVTPSDVLKGRRKEILRRRKEVQARSNGEDSTIGLSGSLRDLYPTPDLSGLNVSQFCWLPTVSEADVAPTGNRSTVVNHIISGVTNYANYTVRVIAQNAQGDSPPSDDHFAMPQSKDLRITSNVVDGATITLTYPRDLDESSQPGTGRFSVLVNGGLRSLRSVAVSGNAVILTLDNGVTAADQVKIRYLHPRWLRESPAPKIGRKQGAGHEANT